MRGNERVWRGDGGVSVVGGEGSESAKVGGSGASRSETPLNSGESGSGNSAASIEAET